MNFLNYGEFLFLKVVFILANSVDPHEMQHDASLHLGLHCKSTPLGVSLVQRVQQRSIQIDYNITQVEFAKEYQLFFTTTLHT